MNKTVSARQLTTFIAVAALSVGVRVLPGSSAAAGRSGLLIAAAALLPGLIIVWMLGYLYKRYPNKSLIEIFNLAVGRWLGGLFLLCAGGLIPLALAAHTARAHAGLFTGTIFPGADESRFVAVALAVMFFITRRGLDRAARMSTLFALMLFIALITVFFGSLESVKADNLLPVYTSDISAFAKAAVCSLSIPAFLIIGNFLSRGVGNKSMICRESVWASLTLCAAMTLITALCFGVLGAGLTERAVSPVFAAAKALSVPGIFERVDAFTVIVWIVTDLMLLILTGFVFTEVLGKLSGAKRTGIFAAPFTFIAGAAALAPDGGETAVIGAAQPITAITALATLAIFTFVFLAAFAKKNKF